MMVHLLLYSNSTGMLTGIMVRGIFGCGAKLMTEGAEKDTALLRDSLLRALGVSTVQKHPP
jgi:hypothetical protein